MRLFIAIELPTDVRDHVSRLRDLVKPHIAKASFTRDENLHITVKFLGEVDSRKLDELSESLTRVRSDLPIEIAAEKIECFPNRGPVRIVAVGFGGALGALKELHRTIEQRCQHLGFDRETRAYRPHVTIARARPVLPASVRAVLDQEAQSQFPGPAFSIDSFALVKSELSSQGSKYETIAKFPISGDR